MRSGVIILIVAFPEIRVVAIIERRKIRNDSDFAVFTSDTNIFN
jgi:hypothetical protein